jgi:hypothetical protein
VTPSLSGAALNPNADVFESKQSEGGIDVSSSWDIPDTEFTSLDGKYTRVSPRLAANFGDSVEMQLNQEFLSPLFSLFGSSLWSSGLSSWTQIRRSGYDSRLYQIFWTVMGLERGPLSPVGTIEELLERKSSGSRSRKPRLYQRGLKLNVKSYPHNKPWSPIGLWDVEDCTLSRQSALIRR